MPCQVSQVEKQEKDSLKYEITLGVSCQGLLNKIKLFNQEMKGKATRQR